MSPKVSVCLPTFNGARYLASAIESIQKQTFKDFELIIIDDGSSDETTQIADSYAFTDSRIKIFRNAASKGLFANYNACMSKAVGELIKPFAQDDLLHENALFESVKVMDQYPVVSIVSVQRVLIDEYGEIIEKTFHYQDRLPKGLPVTAHELASQCLFPVNNCVGEPSTVMFRRRDIGKGFDARFQQIGDIEYWIRLAERGHLYLLEKPLCSFRKHEASASTSNLGAMAGASDVVLISRKHKHLLDVCERGEKEFIEGNVVDLARQAWQAVELGTLDIHKVRQASAEYKSLPCSPSLTAEVEQLIDQLESFRELSFHCLTLMAQLGFNFESARLHDSRQENASKISRLEIELRRLLESYSWRMTKPLRDIRRMTRLGADSIAVQDGFESPADLDAHYQQELYIYHLKTMITRVKGSHSWRITEPLRFKEIRPRFSRYHSER